jgi:hypothetical protein
LIGTKTQSDPDNLAAQLTGNRKIANHDKYESEYSPHLKEVVGDDSMYNM